MINLQGISPLIEAVKRKNLKHVEILLKCGADPNMTDKDKRTSLHYAVNVAETSADASFDLE